MFTLNLRIGSTQIPYIILIAILSSFSACESDTISQKSSTKKSIAISKDSLFVKEIEEVILLEKEDSTSEEVIQKKKTKSQIIDSLFKTSFEGPFIIPEKLDSNTIDKFTQLAKATKGEAVFSVSKEALASTINNIVQEDVVPETDLVILIDKTASMTDDIAKVKEGLKQIISSMSKKGKVRLAIGLYGDINYMGTEWFNFEVFNYDYAKAIDFLENIKLIGNYDDPESVYEAFFEIASSDFWKSKTKRMVILIGDAAPQEKPLSFYTIYDVLNKAKEGKIFMNFYPVLVNPEIVVEKLSDDLQAKKIISKVYPNPTVGEINFEFLDKKEYMIEVYTSTGMNVFREQRNTWFFTHNFSYLPVGAYILRVFDKKGNFDTQQFVIYK